MIKTVGYSSYAHKSNIFELVDKLTENQSRILTKVLEDKNLKMKYKEARDYTIIKYNKQNDSVSLLISEDWDIANEPTVGSSICVKPDLTARRMKGGNKVYHNKWQFVNKDYKGFDIEKAKERTKLWNNIPNIKSLKSKIGNKKIWEEILKENNIEI